MFSISIQWETLCNPALYLELTLKHDIWNTWWHYCCIKEESKKNQRKTAKSEKSEKSAKSAVLPTSLMLLLQNRVVAEIPNFPTIFWITFDLKLTKKPRIPYFYSILHLFGSKLPTPYAPEISYRPTMQYTKKPAVISIKHWLGKRFFYKFKPKELSPGNWTKFEISQAKEGDKLMFKVSIGLLATICFW